MLRIVVVCVAMVTVGMAAAVTGQPTDTRQIASTKQTPLQKADVPGSDYEVAFDIIEISAGVVARHSHPGPTLVYVLEGEFTFLMDGYAVRTFKAGDSFLKPAGVMHEGRGDRPSKIMVVFVVPKGQPLVTPAQ